MSNKKLFDAFTLQAAFLSNYKLRTPASVLKKINDIVSSGVQEIASAKSEITALEAAKAMERRLVRLADEYWKLFGIELEQILEEVLDSSKAVIDSILYRSEESKIKNEKKDSTVIPKILALTTSARLIVAGTNKNPVTRTPTQAVNKIFKDMAARNMVEALDIRKKVLNGKDFNMPMNAYWFNQSRNFSTTLLNRGVQETNRHSFGLFPEITGYRFSAILDAKTTVLCETLHGTIRVKYADLPKPPLHWNCRSIIVPLVGDIEEAGDLPFTDFKSWFAELDSNLQKEWLTSKSLISQTQTLSQKSLSFQSLKTLLNEISLKF